MYEVIQGTDVDPIREYAIEFMESLGEEIDSGYYLNQWQKFLDINIGVLYYLAYNGKVVGGIGGILAPDIFNGKINLVELFWYVTPKHRRAGLLLYKAMKNHACDDPKIKRFAMVHMEKSMPEKLKTFYQSEGFRLLETHWVLEV